MYIKTVIVFHDCELMYSTVHYCTLHYNNLFNTSIASCCGTVYSRRFQNLPCLSSRIEGCVVHSMLTRNPGGMTYSISDHGVSQHCTSGNNIQLEAHRHNYSTFYLTWFTNINHEIMLPYYSPTLAQLEVLMQTVEAFAHPRSQQSHGDVGGCE